MMILLILIANLVAQETPWMNRSRAEPSQNHHTPTNLSESTQRSPIERSEQIQQATTEEGVIESYFEENKAASWPVYYYDEHTESMEMVEEEVPAYEAPSILPKTYRQYRLRVGDRLQVALYGYTEANTSRVVSVDPTGSINYLFAGKVFVLGRTIDEFRHLLQKKVSKEYPNVIVSVTATELFGEKITVMGEVNKPGPVGLAGNLTVLKALGAAGGFRSRPFRDQMLDFADLDRAFLARKGEYVELDFKKLVRSGDTSLDIPMEAGDYIYIPSLIPSEIYVLGEFGQNFVFSFVKPTSLMEVMTWAGGVTEVAGDQICILRGSLCSPIKYLVDYRRISNGCAPDFLLQPGDIVYAPPRKFTLLREVFRSAVRIFVSSIASRSAENSVNKLFDTNVKNYNNSLFFSNGASGI